MRRKGREKHPGAPAAAGGDSQRTRRSRAKRRRLFWAGSVAFIVGLLVYGLLATGPLGGPKAGEPAPDISFATANGEFRLSQQEGKVVVLYFSFPG